MSRLELFLLGDLRLTVDGRPAEIASERVLALLAYLGEEGQPATTDYLANLIWPEYDEVQAQATLRRALWQLKKGPVGPFVSAEGQSVELEPAENIWVDSIELRRQIAAGLGASGILAAERVARVQESVDLYQGEFLARLKLPDGDFVGWVEARRKELQGGMTTALRALGDHYLEEGDYKAAEAMARRQLTFDRFEKGAYRQLMTALERSGRPETALAEYERLKRLLADELGAEPAAETTALFRQIQAKSPAGAEDIPTWSAKTAGGGGPTVFLFSDIESSTPLWDRHREAMLVAFQQHNRILAEEIEGHGGRILESRGDGVRAVFEGGQPLEATIAIQNAFGRADWGEVGDLRIRLGVHGVHVEWEGYDYFRKGDEFFGPVLNYTARVMDAGWGGQIMVSQYVKEVFELPEGGSWQEFGSHRLKGAEEPVELYGLQHPDLPLQDFPPPRTLTTDASQERGAVKAPPPPFLEADEDQSKTPAVFVARERELAQMKEALESTLAGKGQILFVTGGPGRGKSTLVQEFARQAQKSDQDLIVVSGNCNAHTGAGDPYLPFREALMMLTGDVEAQWAGGRISTGHARRLWEHMSITLPALVEEAPELIGSLTPSAALHERAASFAAKDARWFKTLTTIVEGEQRATLQQQRIKTQFAAFLKTIARKGPVLLILEDLHWADASSSDLLFHLSREAEHSAFMIVGTYRPEEVALTVGQERHPLAGLVSEFKRQHGDIWLDLGEQAEPAGRQFVIAYLEAEPNRLSDEFRNDLYQHTGGHALFTVELLRDMQERGDLRQDVDGYWVAAADIDWQSFPARVEGVIESRIGRLDEDLQSVLRVAAVEGEQFTAEVVAKVEELDERSLVRRLSRELEQQHRLITAEALERVGTQRLSQYRFRHHLFQHYLYHSLDQMERAYLHEEVGDVLEAKYGDQSEEIALQLARHFELAGLIEKAVAYLHLSGEKAIRQSANLEAIDHLSRGLELLQEQPASSERDQTELTLQASLGVALQTVRGLAAPEARSAYDRARELGRRVEESPQLFPVLWGLWLYYSVRSEHQTADELAQQLWALANKEGDATSLLLAHRALGSGLFWLGEFVAAQEHLEQVVIGYRPEQHHSLVASYGGSDIKVVCLYFSSMILCWSGYPEQALELSAQAITLSQELDHSYSLVAATLFASWLRLSLRNWRSAQELAESTVNLATELASNFWLGGGLAFRGWAMVGQDNFEKGITELRQGLKVCLATGAGVYRTILQPALGESLGLAGQLDEGLAVLEDALAYVEDTQERFGESEICRIKGELLLAQGQNQAEAQGCYLRAIEVARGQGAKLLELRATVSLCRLWQARGKSAEAQVLLQEIYDWFSEGFETADLQEARALLDELASTVE